MGPPRECICSSYHRPRKGQEVFKGVKKVAPGAIIPAPGCRTLTVSPSKVYGRFHLPGYSVELKITHICRVHLSSSVRARMKARSHASAQTVGRTPILDYRRDENRTFSASV
jgi:hypothetical protein